MNRSTPTTTVFRRLGRWLGPRLGAALLAATCVGIAGCGSQSTPQIPVSGRLERVTGSPAGQIVLSALGAQRIGLIVTNVRAVPPPASPPPATAKTTTAKSSTTGATSKTSGSPSSSGKTTTTPAAATQPPSSRVIVPYAAIVYDPSGKTFAFVKRAALTYTEVAVVVDHISGDYAYLRTGPHAGSKVVSVGAEELYGIQTGVLAQT